MAYIISSGETSSGIILENDSMTVLNGGTAITTTVNAYGCLSVSSGGTATEVVENGGCIQIFDGADVTFASNTFSGVALNSASATVHSGTTANGTILYRNGVLDLSGGVANETAVNYWGCIYAHSGGTANYTTLNNCGDLYVSSGGTANYTTVNSKGWLEVYSSGTANNTMVSAYGYLVVNSGGTANDTTINDGGNLYVSSGGTATISFNPWQGEIEIYSDEGAEITYLERDANVYCGGEAGFAWKADIMDAMSLNSGFSAIVYSGGVANETTVNSDGMLFVSSGGTASETTVNFSGYLYVFSGGTADHATVSNYGNLYVEDGGTADHTTVNSDGYIYVSSGGTANNTTVNSDGMLFVSSGGTATISFNPWQGTINSDEGAEITYLERDANVYCGGEAGFAWKADIMDAMSLNSGFSAIVYSGGIVNDITVDQYGCLYVSSDGTANETTVNFGGNFHIYDGGIASSTTVNSYGCLYVSSGGTADNTTLNFLGDLFVLSGGTAENTTVDSHGCLYVSSGGTANSTTVTNYGHLYVSLGGVADSTTLNFGGGQTVSSGGTANNTTVNRGGLLAVSSGGSANGTTANSGGSLFVLSGGTADNTFLSGGGQAVSSGGTANDTTVNSGGCLFVDSGGTANETTVNSGGHLYVVSGGTADNTTVNSMGTVIVSSGGTANSTTVNSGGYLYVLYGGATANEITINDGGYLYVSSGGRLTGRMTFEDGSVVSATAGSILDFDISGLAPDETARVNDLSFIQGAPDFTLTVSGNEVPGIYLLAEGASGFNSTITVQNTPGEQIGVITVGGTIKYGNCNYNLALEDSVLKVMATERDRIAPTVSNIQVSTTEPTNLPVVVTADFSDNRDELAATLYRIGETGEWTDYAGGVTLYHNSTVYFKATDLDDNESEIVSSTVTNIKSVTGLIVSSGMDISVLEEDVFLDTTVLSEGVFSVSGGTAGNTAVNEGGTFNVNTGIATDATVNEGGMLNVSGGIVDGASVCSGGMFNVNGGTASNISVTTGAILSFDVAPEIYIAGTVDDSLFEIADGIASGLTLGSGFALNICEDGAAENTTVNEGGALNIISYSTAYDTTVNEGGVLNIASGEADGVIVHSGGDMILGGPDACAYYVTVEEGGRLDVGRGSWVKDLTAASGAYLDITVTSNTYVAGTSGGSAFEIKKGYVPGIAFEGGSLSISSGCRADGATVANGTIHVWRYATADQTTLNKGGTLWVSAGGTANSTTINSGGRTIVTNSGTLNDITVNNGGAVSAMVQTTKVNGATVNEGGRLQLAGSATGIIENGGTVVCGSSASVSFTSNTFSGLLISGTTATVHSGTTAAGNTVFGGKGTGTLEVYDGGIATATTVETGGSIKVFAGGTANSTTVNKWGTATIISGRLSDLTVNSGGIVSATGGRLSDLAINSGGIVSATGGRLSDLTINSGGTILAESGSISGVTVDRNGLFAAALGTVNGLAVNSGGSAQITKGTLTGRVMLADNGRLYMKDSILDFDISDLAPDSDAMIGNFSLISGNPTCTLTVSNLHQQTGTYLLASGVETFDKPISVIGRFGDQLGVLSVGGTLTTETGMVMSLALADGLLTLDVNSDNVISTVYANPNYTADITGTVMPNGDVLEFGVNAFANLDLAISAVLKGGDLCISGFNFKTKDISIQKQVNVHLSDVSGYGLFVEPTLSSSTGDISATIERTILNESCYPVCRTGIINGNIDVLITDSTIGKPTGNYYSPTLLVLASSCSFGQDAESVSLTIRNSTVISDINMLSLSSAGTENKPLSVTMTLDHVSMVEDKWFYLFGARNENRMLYTDVTFNLSNSILGSSGQRRTSIAPFYPSGSSTLVGDVTFNVKNLTLYGELAAVACSMDYGTSNAAIRGAATLNVTGGTTYVMRVRSFDVVNIASGAVLQVDGLAAKKVYADGNLLTGSIAAEEVHLRHGTIDNLMIESGIVYVSSGVVLNNARTAGINNVFAGIVVSSGGRANSTTIYSGRLTVSSGGLIDHATVSQNGSLTLISGASAINTYVINGSMFVSSGAVANAISATRGSVTVSSGGTMNSAFVSSGSMTVSSGGIANNAEIRYASLFLQGGTADRTTITGGMIDVIGGTANRTTVNTGTISVSSGGTANSTTVANGSMYVSSGGTAADLLIDSRARVTVLSGGKLTGRITAGVISAYRGAIIDFDLTRTLPGAGAIIYTLANLSGNPDYTLTVNEDQAEGVYMLAGWASGFRSQITVVNTAGTTLGMLTVGSTLSVSDVAYTLNLSKDGMLSLTVGDTLTPTPLPYTSDGAVITDETSVLSGEVYHDTVIAGGRLWVSSGGRTENTAIFGNGSMTVNEGGTAENTNILNSYGMLTVSSGGIARNLSVVSGGSVRILAGGTLTGQISVASGARVFVDGYLDFDISGLTPEAPVLVSNLSFISGSRYSITVSGSQQAGTYKLAEGLSKFKNGALFYVRNTQGEDLGTLSVGKVLKVDGMYYLMSIAGDTLTVTYCEHPVFSGTLLGRNGNDSYASAAHVSSGWVFRDTTVFSNGLFFVSSGGMADSTTVQSRGSMTVLGGGTATNIEVNSSGFVDIRSGFVDGATVNPGGSMRIWTVDSGYVTNIVENGGYVEDKGNSNVIYTSHTIEGLVLANKVSATVHSGTTANEFMINSYGRLDVFSGGIVNNVQVNSYGSMRVSSGGIVNGATVNSMCSMYLSSGAILNGVSVNSRATLRISEGVAANSVTVNSAGYFHVLGSGSANGVTVNAGGRMYVSAYGTATDIKAASGAYLCMAVTQDTFVTGTSGGRAFVIRDGVLSDYTVESGCLRVYEDGALDRISVVSGGSMVVETGGTATNIEIASGAYLFCYIDSATRISGLSGGSAFEIADGVVSNYMLGHELYLLSGAVASVITVADGGYCHVSGGGVADHAAVGSGGLLYVEAGGTATNIYWNPCEGRVVVEEGGYATFANQHSGVYYGSAGKLVSTAASMGSISIGYEERIFVMDGGTADSITVDANGEMTVSNGGVANAATVNSGGYLYVSSGAAANAPTIGNGGSLSIFSGGAAAEITENGGYVYVSDDAEATFVANAFSGLELSSATLHSGTTANDNTLVGYYGCLEIYSGGTADNTAMNGYFGNIFIYNGGTANRTTVDFYGHLQVSSGGIANSTTINSGGNLYVSSGGTANNTMVNSGGELQVSSGGIANNTTVNLFGYLQVSSGGAANNTTVNSGGYLNVSSGGIANGATVNSGGYLYVSSGGKLTGQTGFEAGAIVSAYSGSILDFDISGLTPDTTAPVCDLQFVYGKPNYTLTVSAAQEYGTYLLATGTVSFNSLTVLDPLGERLGTLHVGQVFLLDDYSYRLKQTDGTLSLSVQERDIVAPTVSNIRFSTTEPTNLPVVVTADFSDNNGEIASALYRIGETGEWTAYGNSVSLYRNTDLFFKAVNLDGNESEIVGCTVANIGTITGLVVSSGMEVSVPDGETFLDTTIVDTGSFWGGSGGTANNTTVNGGWFSVESGGMADGITVNPGGELYVLSGGTAANIVWTPCEGIVDVEKGGQASFVSKYSGVYYGSAGHLLSSAAVMSSMTLAEEEIMYAMSGGTASDIMLDCLGRLLVSSGGTATGITINDESELYVTDGGVASGIVVNEYGDLLIFAGAVVDDITLGEGSWILVNGGTATNVTADAGVNWRLVISPETFITGTINDTGLDVKDGLLSGFSVDCGYLVEIVSGGTANNTAVKNGGSLEIYDGGVANSTTVSDDAWVIVSGGTANNTAVISYGCFDVSFGGTANNTAVNGYYGRAHVFSGGIARGTTVWDAASFIVLNDGIADDTTVNEGGYFNISSGGVANNTTVNFEGTLNISSGGVANNTAIESGGYLNVFSCAIGNNTTVNSGWAWIEDGGVANDTTVNSSGELYVLSGGKQTGRMVIEEGAIVLFSKSSVLDFDISLHAPGSTSPLLNDFSLVDGIPTFTLTVSSAQESGTYLLADGATDFEGSIAVVNNTSGKKLGILSTGNPFVMDDGTKYTLNLNDAKLSVTVAPPSDITPQTQTWEKVEEAAQYIVEYSTDNFEHVIQLVVDSNSLDSFQMPAGNYQMRVKADDGDEWTVVAPVVAEEAGDEPKLIRSNADGNADIFFVNAVGTWDSIYVAQHVGSTGDDTWGGTLELATLSGKNKLTDIIEGSTDANILLMTDDENGDALFVDDIYSASPDELGLSQSRIAQIDEIRAGAGNDIVDMTSHRFEYTGDGLTILGGDGNDTIWANKGDNRLFGDAGNDRIVGASGNDVIVGGSGNDSMHGGGGNDVFTFCDNWGVDEVEQLATGSVTLWFAESKSQITVAELDGNSVFTNAAGTASVTVKGFSLADIAVKYGDDGSDDYAALAFAGAFIDAASERIFEETGKGVLAIARL